MPAATKEQKEKIAAIIKLQATNGSFELTPNLCQTLGQNYDSVKKEAEDKRFDFKAWATTLVLEYIDLNLQTVKQDNIKAYDKAKLFVFKVWADSQPFLKLAASTRFKGKTENKGVDADGRPIV